MLTKTFVFTLHETVLNLIVKTKETLLDQQLKLLWYPTVVGSSLDFF